MMEPTQANRATRRRNGTTPDEVTKKLLITQAADGSFRVDCVDGATLLEAPTVLRLAAMMIERQLGLRE